MILTISFLIWRSFIGRHSEEMRERNGRLDEASGESIADRRLVEGLRKVNSELKEEISRMSDEFIAAREEMERRVWERAALEERMSTLTHVVGGEASKLILLAGVLIEDIGEVAQVRNGSIHK